jgi:hypothetical protein
MGSTAVATVAAAQQAAKLVNGSHHHDQSGLQISVWLSGICTHFPGSA